MFQQKEGQKTQEKETQTALRLCKKHIFGTFLDLKPSLNTRGTAVKEKKIKIVADSNIRWFFKNDISHDAL